MRLRDLTLVRGFCGPFDFTEVDSRKERTSNLLLAILEKFGIHRERVGDSTEMLAI